MKWRHQHCPSLQPEQTSWWAGKDISLFSLCLMTLMQHMALFLAKWFGWSHWCRYMMNGHLIVSIWKRGTFFCPPPSVLCCMIHGRPLFLISSTFDRCESWMWNKGLSSSRTYADIRLLSHAVSSPGYPLAARRRWAEVCPWSRRGS